MKAIGFILFASAILCGAAGAEQQNASDPRKEQDAGIVSAQVQKVVNPAAQGGYHERVRAVHGLSANLRGDEIDVLCSYLLAPGGGLERNNENWLRNDIMDKLGEQESLPACLSGVLSKIYNDAKQDPVMRDYAVQHMVPAYNKYNETEKQACKDIIWKATQENNSIAGTALLALARLSEKNAEFDRKKIAEIAMQIASDDGSNELARITAMQICGRLRATGAALLALNLARNAASVPLRVAAIAALGDLGDSATTASLKSLASSSDRRIQVAIKSALRKLNRRDGSK